MVGREGGAMPANRRRLAQSSSVVGAASVVAFAFATSARPRAYVIRALLSGPTARVRRKVTPVDGIETIRDERYDDNEPDARLDVYFPATAPGERRPTVVWIHGGAWVSGRKEDAAHYFERIAAAGFTVVAVEYARAPSARYPIALRQVNDAVAYVRRHAARFHVDEARLFLAGDSAGAQMASQLATLATSPSYAAILDIDGALDASAVRGCVLFGGLYDAKAEARYDSAVLNAALQLFIKSVLWAYTGERDRDCAVLREMSTIDHATSAFPPTFISGGSGDPFTEVHSRPFATRLAALGVDVTPRFFADHEPRLRHQYEFDVGRPESQATLEQLLEFLQHRVASCR
jgi:acetyl esterase/lipase